MRRLIAAVVLSVLTLGTTVACGGDDGDVVTKPKSKTPAAKDSSTSAKPDGGGGEPDAGKAAVGDTVSLKGLKRGSRIDATVEDFVDPAKPANAVLKPAAGKKWVAARLKLVNKGAKVYEDAPINGAQVADKTGQRFPGVIGEVTAGPAMATPVKIPSGEAARGWVTFEVPQASVVTSVQWTPDSGFSADTGQWQVD
ncbi:DUF4352 domain-containing protein [Streptomyces sp. NPDC052114]|uniref:DUF4352 domain-containing protein n=1 Tax=unclassified Streptomyces TaxID=2593676 RepID=UPI00343B4729